MSNFSPSDDLPCEGCIKNNMGTSMMKVIKECWVLNNSAENVKQCFQCSLMGRTLHVSA